MNVPVLEVDLVTAPGGTPSTWTAFALRTPDQGTVGVDVVTGGGRLTGFEAGEATLHVDDPDRLYDPTNASSTIDPLRRHARVTVDIGGNVHNLFRGFVDGWDPVWPDQGYDAMIQVTLVDGLSALGLQDSDLDLAQQMSGTRVTALLDAAGWPAGLRDIDTGRLELEALAQEGANLLRSLYDVADAEQGDVFVDSAGNIVFRDRHARLDQTPAVTLGGAGYEVEDITSARDLALLTNVGRVELESGDAWEAIDDASVARFGRRVFPIRDLALRAAEAEALAQWIVVRYADPLTWVESVTLLSEDPIADIVDLEIGDLVRLQLTLPTGDPIDQKLHVERVHHAVAVQSWKTTLGLSPYFGEGPWFTLDDATLGQLTAGNKLAP